MKMKCSFCGHEIGKGTETIFVTSKGKAHYMCSSKCEKNMFKLNRKPRKTKWTEEYRKEKNIRVKGGVVTPTEEEMVKETKPTADEKKSAEAKKEVKKSEKKTSKTGKKESDKDKTKKGSPK